jgi:nitronate monooxygenase
MIVDARADDILYSDVFTGVHGNYLRPSIVAAGLDPNALPEAKDMDFAKLTGGEKKAWRDVWGCGQGIGAIDKVQPAADFIAGLRSDYRSAVEGFTA